MSDLLIAGAPFVALWIYVGGILLWERVFHPDVSRKLRAMEKGRIEGALYEPTHRGRLGPGARASYDADRN